MVVERMVPASVARPRALAALGAATVLATVVGSFVFPLTAVRMERPSAGLIPESDVWSALEGLPWPVPVDGVAIAVWIVATAGVAIVAYAAAVVAAWGQPATRRLLTAVLVPAGLALLVSTLALPTQSSDIVDYLLSGRVAVVHDADPLSVPPDAFPEDPLLSYASGQYTADPEAKPPIWLAAAKSGAAVTQGLSPANAVLVARFMFLGLTVVNAGLIAIVLRRRRSHHLLAGLVIYLWNPIILLHGQAKADTLMATFALLAGVALVGSRPLVSIAALWASVMVKLLTLPLIAVTVLGDLVARRWRRLGASALVVGVITVGLYAPSSGGITSVADQLTDSAGSGSSLPFAAMLAFAAFAAVVIVWHGIGTGGEVDATIQAWAVAAMMIAPLSLASSSWYLIMPIAIVSLSGERWRTGAIIGLTAVAYLLDIWGRSSNPRHPLPEPFGLSRSGAALIGCAVVAVAGLIIVSYVRSTAPEPSDHAERVSTGSDHSID